MGKRVTSIAMFDNESLTKLKQKVNMIHEKLCKVPYIEKNRNRMDTLPYHFTFCVWDIKEKDKAVAIIKNIKFKEIILNITGVKIKESYDNSWNLYFDIERNDELYTLQKKIYNCSKIEKYNPDRYIPHITIHCDKDFNRINKLKDRIGKKFTPIKVRFSKIGLFEIYPVKIINKESRE